MIQPLWRTVWRFLKKLKIELPLDPAIPLVNVYTKEMRTEYQRDICTPMFIAALFTMAPRYGNKLCPSVNEWINQM